jgi:hypothetical protein
VTEIKRFLQRIIQQRISITSFLLTGAAIEEHGAQLETWFGTRINFESSDPGELWMQGVTTVYAMQPRPSFHYPDSRRIPLLVVEVHLRFGYLSLPSKLD